MPTVFDLALGTLLLGPLCVFFLDEGISSVRSLFQEFVALTPLCRVGFFLLWLAYRHLLGWVRLLAVADVTALDDLASISSMCNFSKSSNESVRRSEALLKMMIESLGKQLEMERTVPHDLKMDMLRPDDLQEVGMPQDISNWNVQQVLDELF